MDKGLGLALLLFPTYIMFKLHENIKCKSLKVKICRWYKCLFIFCICTYTPYPNNTAQLLYIGFIANKKVVSQV